MLKKAHYTTEKYYKNNGREQTMITEIIQRNFRYTFQRSTLANLDLTEGLYAFNFRKSEVVISIDKFGEARIANETPVNNHGKLAKALVKAA